MGLEDDLAFGRQAMGKAFGQRVGRGAGDPSADLAARALAEESGSNLLLTDGPPGVGCPVIASIGGASALLIVTEPTVSGRHDMDRVARLAAHFKVPAMVCVNKFDLNLDETGAIEAYAAKRGFPLVGKLPFDPVFTKAMLQGKTVLEYGKHSNIAEDINEIWEAILELIEP